MPNLTRRTLLAGAGAAMAAPLVPALPVADPLLTGTDFAAERCYTTVALWRFSVDGGKIEWRQVR